MKKKFIIAITALTCLSMITGCSTRGSGMRMNNNTNILREDNAEMAAVTKINVHYARGDSSYDGWGIWTWQKAPTPKDGKMVFFKTSDGEYGNYCTLSLTDDATFIGAKEIGFIVKTHTTADLTTWDGTGKIDVSGDRFIQVPEEAPGGIMDIYLYEGDSNIMYSKAEALKDKLLKADFTGDKTITAKVVLSEAQAKKGLTSNDIHLLVDGVEDNSAVRTFNASTKTVSVTLLNNADLSHSYQIKIGFEAGELSLPVGLSYFYDKDDFINNFTYTGDDLGVTFNEERTATTFKVWAPISIRVILNIYNTGTSNSYIAPEGEITQNKPSKRYEMHKEQHGVWSITIPANLNGKYYTYTVYNGPAGNEVVDPYAKSCGINGDRGLVIDMAAINEEIGWDEVQRPNRIAKATDASIYEVHVRDVSIHPTSGVSDANKGKYLGLGEKNTKYVESGTEYSTGLAHIKDLGVTHIQLQPIYDFASVSETVDTPYDQGIEDNINYNWGYDPKNYNCLEGSYSSNPYDGFSRVKEFKQMLKSIYEENIEVNMDVVFNHTFGSSDTNFEQIIPGYYHRFNADGSYSNGSGCGNEMASERSMYRKFVVDSCKFWLTEYKLSGFRFDLMALLDTTTMEQVYLTCAKEYPHVLVYGEPWAGGDSLDTYQQSTQDSIQTIEGVGAFNDHFRDAVRGKNDPSKGWCQNNLGAEQCNNLVKGIWGQFNDYAKDPAKTLNYVSCHDNYTLYDQFLKTDSANIEKKVVEAQALTFFAQGITFIHGGEEFLRTKGGEHNSYNKGDAVNAFDYSRKARYIDQYEMIKLALDIRNGFEGFRIGTNAELENGILTFNAADNCMDFTVKYDGRELRVIAMAGSGGEIPLGGEYSLIFSNDPSDAANVKNKIKVSSYGLEANEIAVFEK